MWVISPSKLIEGPGPLEIPAYKKKKKIMQNWINLVDYEEVK